MGAPSSAPYYKANLAWPVARSGWGFTRVTLVERYETAIIHLMSTKRGSYYADPEYGSIVYRLRTQNITDGLRELVLEDVRRGTATYIPDILVYDLRVETIDSDECSYRVSAFWNIRGATPTQKSGGEPASRYNVAALLI